jgi:hypothetical protein
VYLFFSLVFCVSLFAQGAAGGAAGQSQQQQQQPQQQQQAVYPPEDGGTTEILQSTFIPSKMHAPFSLTLHTEWVRTLSDGNTITLINQRHIYRDSQGRIFQERVMLVPKTGKYVSRVTTLQYADPKAHAVYNCFQDSRNQCVRLPYDPSPSMDYKPVSPKPGPLPNGMGNGEHEDLGQQSIEGVETVGIRDRVTYSPGVWGNDAPMTVEHESWYSPQLGINLLSIRTDPRLGKQTFRATDISTAEPDPSLFQLPKGYKVVSPVRPENEPDTTED